MSAQAINRSNFFIYIKSQVPEEEKNLGPDNRLIHVYHFNKETAQNQMVYNMDELINIHDLFWLLRYFLECPAILHYMHVLRIYILFSFNSKCKILVSPFSWSFMKVKLWLKLNCGYKRNCKFLMKSSPRFFHTFLTHHCHSLFHFTFPPLKL